MDKAEFDIFADEYGAAHAQNVRITGEQPEFFAKYKVDALAQAVRRRFQQGGPRRILDFGSGVGNSIPHLKAHFPTSQLVAADVSRRSLELSATRFPGLATSMQIDEQIPCEDEQFDLAFTACVFHHISHDEHRRWLEEIRRVMRPGALFAIFEHNPWNPLVQRAVSTCPFDRNARLISMPKMRQRLVLAGFEIVSARYTLFFPALLKFLRPIEGVLAPVPLGGQYWILARRPF